MELPEEVWTEVLKFVPPLFYFVLEDVCAAWREFVQARTPEFRGSPWCWLRPPRVDVAALASQNYGPLLEAAERAGRFSWTDRIRDQTDWYCRNLELAVTNAAQCGHAVLVHRLLVLLPSDALNDHAINHAAQGGHASLLLELVDQSLARLSTEEQKSTERMELYSRAMLCAAQKNQWSLVCQLVDLVDIAQCRLKIYDVRVIDRAVIYGDIQVYSYLSTKLYRAPNAYCAVYGGSVEMLSAVLANGHATLEQVRDCAFMSSSAAMFDTLGAPQICWIGASSGAAPQSSRSTYARAVQKCQPTLVKASCLINVTSGGTAR